MTTTTTTRPRLRPAASVLTLAEDTSRDCDCGRPECLSARDATDIAHLIVSTYIECDDLTAERVRASYGIPGPRSASAAERWYSRWAGDLAEALAKRVRPRGLAVAADVQLALA